MRRRYRQFTLLVPLVLVGYSLIALIGSRLSGTEPYPFFNWELFSAVPTTFSDYGLEVVALEGTPLPSPRYFEASPDLFGEARSIIAQSRIQAVGYAVASNAPDRAALQAALHRDLFGQYQQVEYRIVLRTWAPLERYRTGRFSAEQVIATLVSVRP